MKKYLHSVILICVIGVASANAQQNIIWSVQEPDAETNRAAVAASPDGRLVATGRADSNDVKIWDASNGTLIRVLNGANNNANVIAFSPDGQYLATGTGQPGQGLSLNLWRVSDGLRLVGRIPVLPMEQRAWRSRPTASCSWRAVFIRPVTKFTVCLI